MIPGEDVTTLRAAYPHFAYEFVRLFLDNEKRVREIACRCMLEMVRQLHKMCSQTSHIWARQTRRIRKAVGRQLENVISAWWCMCSDESETVSTVAKTALFEVLAEGDVQHVCSLQTS